MIRRVSFISRKAGLATDEFFAHWIGRHAELVRQLPGLRGLRFTRVDRCVAGSRRLGRASARRGSTASRTATARSRPSRFTRLLFADREQFIGESQSCYVEEPAGFAPPDGASR